MMWGGLSARWSTWLLHLTSQCTSWGYGFFVPSLVLTKVFISETPPPPENFSILDRYPTVWDPLYIPIQLLHLKIETFHCHSSGCDFLGESCADMWQHVAVIHCKREAACPYCSQYLCFDEVPSFTHPGLFCQYLDLIHKLPDMSPTTIFSGWNGPVSPTSNVHLTNIFFAMATFRLLFGST